MIYFGSRKREISMVKKIRMILKKILCVYMIALLVVMNCINTVEAKEYSTSVSGFIFSLNYENNTADIELYTGNDNIVRVPDNIYGFKVVTVRFVYNPDEDNLKKIKEIVLPEGIKEIGYGAFQSCVNLDKINIPNSVQTIGANAFYNCYKLKEIKIPAKVEKINGNIVRGCNSLNNIVVDKKNKIYSSGKNCNAIIETKTNKLISGCAKTIIPKYIQTIGATAFDGQKRLERIDIPESVKCIENAAFSECENLKELKLPMAINEICDSAFWKCKNLKVINIPKDIKSIGNGVFADCESLEEIELPDKIKTIGYNAFANCLSLKNIIIPKNVSYIGSNAFYGCKSLKEIYISQNVNEIEKGAFVRCSSLEKISVNNKNTKYDSRNNCNGIVEKKDNKLIAACKNTKIPSDIEIIGSDVFAECTDLTEIELPATVKLIEDSAFSECRNLKSITIPKKVTHIGACAFENCESLKEIFIPKNVEKVDWTSFLGCSGLENIRVDEDNRYYDSRQNCNAIILSHNIGQFDIDVPLLLVGCKNTIIPRNTLIDISAGAFRDNKCLTSINITPNVSIIGDGAFEGCSNLESITVDSKNVKYDSRNNCNAIIYTDTNELIVGCKNTKIENTVTAIKSCAFRDCTGLESINIPKSIKNIGYAAFAGCYNLKTMKIMGSDIVVSDNVFKYGNEKKVDCKIIYKYPDNTRLTLSDTFVNMVIRGKLQLKAKVTGDKDVKITKWKSSDSSIASVSSNGIVCAKKSGTVEITVTLSNGKHASCRVIVERAPEEIQLNKKIITLKKGQEFRIKYKIPSYTYTVVTFKSNNNKVASVDRNGKIKALKRGKTVITAKTTNGIKATCKVTVK